MPLISAPTVGRIFQSAGERRLHPGAGFGREPEQQIAATVRENFAILRIAREDRAGNVAPREITLQVKTPGIPRRRDRLGETRQADFVAELRRDFPARPHRRVGAFALPVDLDRIELKKETSRSRRCRVFGFARDCAGDGDRPRSSRPVLAASFLPGASVC